MSVKNTNKNVGVYCTPPKSRRSCVCEREREREGGGEMEVEGEFVSVSCFARDKQSC